MRANEFTNEEVLDELKPEFVNQLIAKQPGWGSPVPGQKNPPRGATATVWQHMADPNTVVKVVGGGRSEMNRGHKLSSVAFVNFLVKYGKLSPHFPICYGIQTDFNDPEEPVQIRMEKLFPLPGDEAGPLAWALSDIGEEPNDGYAQESLRDILIETGLNKVNNVRQIAKAVNLLDRKAPEFEKKYGLSLVNDLHSGNWLMTQKGVIVMADPWYSNHSPSPTQASGSWSW